MKPITLASLSMLLFATLGIISCQRQSPTTKENDLKPNLVVDNAQPSKGLRVYGPELDYNVSISQYIPSVFQDSWGRKWFATNGDGVAMQDSGKLTYFAPEEGFGDRVVRDIAEDGQGNLWFATTNGVTRYNGSSFTNFTIKDGLPHPQGWSLLVDREGTLWVGTQGGVARFNGKSFEPFLLPLAEVEIPTEAYPTYQLVNDMEQDRAGNIWFATNGNGVFKYDGKSLVQLTDNDGLGSNFVRAVIQDKQGNMWFSTLYGGVSRYDGKAFKKFDTRDGLETEHVWTIFEDRDGNIWMADRGGALRYDGKTFTRFWEKEGLGSKFVQSFMQDDKGTIWFGTSGGVYRFDGKEISAYKKADANARGC